MHVILSYGELTLVINASNGIILDQENQRLSKGLVTYNVIMSPLNLSNSSFATISVSTTSPLFVQ